MKKNVSLPVILLLVLSMFLSACGVASTPPTTVETEAPAVPFDLEAYKQTVSDAVTEINDASVILYNVIKKEIEFCKTFEKISGSSANPEKAFQTAIEWLEEKSDYSEDTILEQYETISEMYKTSIAADVVGNEAEGIKELLDEMFTAYFEMHNMALDPSGSISALTDRYNEQSHIILTNTDKLEILLK